MEILLSKRVLKILPLFMMQLGYHYCKLCVRTQGHVLK